MEIKVKHLVNAINETRHLNIKETLGDDYANIVLQDNDTPYGGTAFEDETLGEFMDEIGIKPTDSMKKLNQALKDCGIKTL